MTGALEVRESRLPGEIAPLWSQWMLESGAAQIPGFPYWESLFQASGDRLKVLLVTLDGTPRGLISGCLIPHGGQVHGWILHLYVDRAAREDAALFHALLNHLQGFFAAARCAAIVVELCHDMEHMGRIREILLAKGYTHRSSLYFRQGEAIL